MARTYSAASTNISSASSPSPKASSAASSTRRARSSACWSRCSSRTRAASTTRAAARAACSSSRRSSSRRTAAGRNDLSIFGQESNPTTWRLCQDEPGDPRHRGQSRPATRRQLPRRPAPGPEGRLHPGQSAVQRLRLGRRAAARGRALAVRRAAGRQRQLRLDAALHPPPGPARRWPAFVLANGSMSSNQSGEGEIRRAIVEADLVDCIVALPGQLFYTTQIPVCLWFLTRDKSNGQVRANGSATARARPCSSTPASSAQWRRAHCGS